MLLFVFSSSKILAFKESSPFGFQGNFIEKLQSQIHRKCFQLFSPQNLFLTLTTHLGQCFTKDHLPGLSSCRVWQEGGRKGALPSSQYMNGHPQQPVPALSFWKWYYVRQSQCILRVMVCMNFSSLAAASDAFNA